MSVRSMWVRLRSTLLWLTSLLAHALRLALGEVRWSPPGWARWSVKQVAAGVHVSAQAIRRHPRQSAAIAAAAVVVIGGGYGGWRYYQSLPKPVLTKLSVEEPPVTCYACKPAGKPHALRVTFSGSAAPLEQVGKDLDPKSGSIQVSPALKGTWHWDNDRVLRFTPAQDWLVGVQYTVNLARKGFVARQVLLNAYRFDFHTPAFAAKIDSTEFNQDPLVAADKKVVVSVSFTHPVDPQDFEKRVALNLFEKITDKTELDRGKLAFSVIYDRLRLNAYIHSAQLTVPDKTGRVALHIGSGVHAARGGNETQAPLVSSVAVPGLYSLAVERLDLQVVRDQREEPSQALFIQMSQAVRERDMPSQVHAWLLPDKHPDAKIQAAYERPNKPPYPPYPFAFSDVTPEVLAASTPLSLTQIPGELEHYEVHSFKHEATPGQRVYVRVDKGLESFGGYRLGSTVSRLLQVPDYPHEVKIAQQGSLLAFSGAKNLTVFTRDIQALHVEVGRLLPRQIQHLVSQTEGTYSLPDFDYHLQDSDITERFKTTIRLPELKPGAPHYEAVPLAQYLADDAADRRGIFLIKVQAWDPKRDAALSPSPEGEFVRNDMNDMRLVVVTDLGMIVKKSLDGSQDLFVQSIHTGEPMGEVHVDVLGRNGLPVLSGTTDPEGHVHFADLRGFKREQEPTLYLARHGADSSFLPVEERDRKIDLSRFDAGGVANSVDQGTLSAYLFSDRGLYRPGEEIRLGAIVRAQNWQRDLRGVPLRLDIVDPRGINVRSERLTPGAAGFAEVRQPTRESDYAGTYTVSLSIERQEGRGENQPIGTTTVQVRDFQPDRLAMSTHFSTEESAGWVSPENLTAMVSLRNLFGTPAAQRRVTAQMTLSPAFPSFQELAGYQFYDPQAAQQSFDDTLAPVTTNDKGEAALVLNLQRFARATYRVDLSTEGFEADGGRGVSSAASQLVSNMPYLVGWKADGALDYVARDSQRAVDVLAVDPHLKKIEVKALKLTRVETRYISTLIKLPNGTYQYQSRAKESVLEERELNVPAAGMKLPLITSAPGHFAYLVSDATGQKLGRIEYQVAGDANVTRSLEKNAELQITLSSKDYKPGQDIEMQIQAPYTGSGLITIERDRVYAWRWFHSRTLSSTQKIKLPEGIEGNAYVHVAFVRDPASEEIYTSPLSDGVQPFSVNLDARRNPVHLQAPALVKPGDTLKIGYSTAHPSRIVLFAVDEGILQVSRYKTPDPLGHFFQKRSLDVTTTQILDLILPEIRAAGSATAPGGDAAGELMHRLNPFHRKGDKPVAFWSGVLDADSTAREAEYTVPDYFNGSLRIMAVAVSDEAIGVQQITSTSRGDFVLSPNAPTTVSPGDEFEVSLGVANNLKGSGPNAQLAVALKAGAGLEVIGPSSQSVGIAENREGSAIFKLKALERLGDFNLQFTASSGASNVRRTVDVSVRPASPFMTTLAAGRFQHTHHDVPVDRSLYAENRELSATASLTPVALSRGLVAYLMHYPWVCTEQIVSVSLPALLLTSRPELGLVVKEPHAQIQDIVNELRVRQNEDGAYRLWPAGRLVAEFPALYAQQFLLEAGARGERIPADVLRKANTWIKTVAARDGDNLDEERNTAYAIYLLTRQGTVMPAETAALRKRLTARYKGQWEQDVAAIWLAGALKLMHQDADAQALIHAVRFGASTQPGEYEEPMTRDAWLLYVLAKHFPDQLSSLPADALDRISSGVSSNIYDSLSAGTTILALDAYSSAVSVPGEARLSVAEVLDPASNVRPLELPPGVFPKVAFDAGAHAIRFNSDTDLSAYYLVTQAGFDRAPPKEALSHGLEIIHELTDSSGQVLSQIKMGEEAEVHLKVRAIDDNALGEVAALVDLLPGGFELVMPPQPASESYQEASPEPSEDTAEAPAGTESESESASQTGECSFCQGPVPDGLSFVEPREDRVVVYLTLSKDVQELVYKIKATNAGTYWLPPAFGELMYHRALQAHSAAGHIEVLRP